jgi:hypothetical protein
MSSDKTTRLFVESRQQGENELFKGYDVKQRLDVKTLQIPKNLGTAAITPQGSGHRVPVPAEPKKQ